MYKKKNVKMCKILATFVLNVQSTCRLDKVLSNTTSEYIHLTRATSVGYVTTPLLQLVVLKKGMRTNTKSEKHGHINAKDAKWDSLPKMT